MSIVSSIINTAGNIANARNSQSTNVSDSVGSSWGSSASSSWNRSRDDAVSDSYANSISDSISESQADEYGYGIGESRSNGENRTFGREASAQDVLNAAEANAVQRDLWTLQADYNAKQAQVDRDWQEYMSNTSYQRAVLDLLKAGLNPILAAGNMGASTPVGAMATSGLASAYKANATAEQTGYNSAYSYNRSENTGRSSSYSKSHSESDSKSHSESHGTSSGGSSSHSSEGSRNKSHSEGQSTAKTQLDQMASIVNDLTKAGGAKAQTGQAYNPKTADPKKNGSDANSTKNNGHTKRPSGLS